MECIESLYEKLEDFIDYSLRAHHRTSNHCARIPVHLCRVLITNTHVYIPVRAVYKINKNDYRAFERAFPGGALVGKTPLFIAVLPRYL